MSKFGKGKGKAQKKVGLGGMVAKKGKREPLTADQEMNRKRREYETGYIEDLVEMEAPMTFAILEIGSMQEMDEVDEFGKRHKMTFALISDEDEMKLIISQRFKSYNKKDGIATFFKNAKGYGIVKALAGDGAEEGEDFYQINIDTLRAAAKEVSEITVSAESVTAELDDGDFLEFGVMSVDSLVFDGERYTFTGDEEAPEEESKSEEVDDGLEYE